MEKRNSIEKMNAYIEEKQNDQDFQQKMKIIPIFFLEFYRVIIGSFLLFREGVACFLLYAKNFVFG